jgi:hypothetical protein
MTMYANQSSSAAFPQSLRDRDGDDIPLTPLHDTDNVYEERYIQHPVSELRRLLHRLFICSGRSVGLSRSCGYSFQHVGLKRGAIILLCIISSAFGLLHILRSLTGQASLFWNDGTFPLNEDGLGVEHHPNTYGLVTHNAQPVPCHSHNDYWRPRPLLDAISVGCSSVETDVWLIDGELYVGHRMHSLDENKSLRSMYLSPLLEMLDRQMTSRDSSVSSSSPAQASIFHKDPNTTLVLLVDFKTSGPETFHALHEHLQPLRDKDYLTYHDGQNRTDRAITVVATGNVPFDSILANDSHRDIFYDAPLQRLWQLPQAPIADTDRRTFEMDYGSAMADGLQPAAATTPSEPFDTTNSFYASVSFRKAVGYVWRGHLSPKQMRIIRGHISGARRKGLKVRYWDTPVWPIALRNHVWHVLFKEGADVLSVDDVEGCARADWDRSRRSWWEWW